MRKNYQNSRQGFREHLGVFVRSSWENNVLLWLMHMGYEWEYEPRIFYFEDIKRGTRGYTPDIYVAKSKDDKPVDRWIEIKGYIRPQDKTKVRRFQKYYPEDFAKLTAITKNKSNDATEFFNEMGVPIFAYYDDLVKRFKNKLMHWE